MVLNLYDRVKGPKPTSSVPSEEEQGELTALAELVPWDTRHG